MTYIRKLYVGTVTINIDGVIKKKRSVFKLEREAEGYLDITGYSFYKNSKIKKKSLKPLSNNKHDKRKITSNKFKIFIKEYNKLAEEKQLNIIIEKEMTNEQKDITDASDHVINISPFHSGINKNKEKIKNMNEIYDIRKDPYHAKYPIEIKGIRAINDNNYCSRIFANPRIY